MKIKKGTLSYLSMIRSIKLIRMAFGTHNEISRYDHYSYRLMTPDYSSQVLDLLAKNFVNHNPIVQGLFDTRPEIKSRAFEEMR